MFRKDIIAASLLLLASLTACSVKKDLTQTTQVSAPAATFGQEALKGHEQDIPKEKTLQYRRSNANKASTPALLVTPSGKGMESNMEEQFYYEELSEDIKERITGKSYGKNCDIPYEELRYVKVTYWGFDAEPHNGELIVNKAIAEDIVWIFKELYDKKYKIEQMVLVDEYNADDNASMAANNTSSFNYRNVDGTSRLSLHSYGLAIDINPLYNPYVRGSGDDKVITPENGKDYADRTLDCKYYISEGDICYKAFSDRGFTWGGNWKSQKDYQHFEKKLEQ